MDVQRAAEEFISKWRGVAASELSTAQTFVLDFCSLLGVDRPHPTPDQDYMFERPVQFHHGDGTVSDGRIDCYRRGCFVLEAKKIRAGVHTKGFDDALLRARAQGEGYARALPASEGRPPFVVVVDVGSVIELYSEFTRSGGTYTPFPDPRSHRIRIEDLSKPAVRENLALIWTDPMRLDPARANAKVTRDVAVQLAKVARSLEAAGHSPHDVAAFLTRCLFSMFAEDVDLLPRLPNGDGAFVDLLKRYREDPPTLQRMMGALWVDMDRGGFSAALAKDLLRFNGKLFKVTGSSGYALPLNREQIDGLLAAAKASWREVEPAIFGTLLERALDPAERHALGAHYTPRSYVERLVLPTVVEPLREDWGNAQAAAFLLANEANELDGKKRDEKLAEARAEVRRFHHRLCEVRVLDPACGSGNFLYVTLEHLKRLEGEVINQLETLGDAQARLHLEGQTVTLKQLLGIEINERAAALAELVLWIGYLQWHIRTFGNASVAEPVVHDYGNIEFRDAVLAYDRQEPMYDGLGKPVTRWDGTTFKLHPSSGKRVPDESAQVLQSKFVNPRPAEWPVADFVVGNPPFLGKLKMREALGEGYVAALRDCWTSVPDSADFVMYWWSKAADLTSRGQLRRFGLITTNSLTMIYNRKIVAQALESGVRLAWAIADHPWVDSSDGAAVRIAMTVGDKNAGDGHLLTVTDERAAEFGEADVSMSDRVGTIQADLKIGPKVLSAVPLQANRRMSNTGYILGGRGFVITASEARSLLTEPGAQALIHPLFNGNDITGRPRDLYVIDAHGQDSEQLRARAPAVWQRLHDLVWPERQVNPDPKVRRNWWLFRRSNEQLRESSAGLPRLIVTSETAKHRLFAFIDAQSRPEHKLMVISSPDGFHLGILSSRLHAAWAVAAGGTLEDRPVYNKSTCFEAFPFPSDDTGLTPELEVRIRALAEQIDAHRKARQAAHSELTLTGMYNVLETLRLGEALTSKERLIHEHALIAVLKALHDELDAAVLAAYGWADLKLPADTDLLLERLVALNARRAAEEAAGRVRWLRPQLQEASQAGAQAAIELGKEEPAAAVPTIAAAREKQPWPTTLPDQIKAIAELLSSQTAPVGIDTLAAGFTARGRWKERLPTILQTLEALGRARQVQPSRWIDPSPR